jgi:hypothetical protein
LVGCEWICVNANVSIDTDGFIDNDEDRRFSADALLSDKGYPQRRIAENLQQRWHTKRQLAIEGFRCGNSTPTPP